MAALLYRLGTSAYRRWPLFLAAWLVALLGVGTVAVAFSKPMTSTFTMPGIPSMKAADLQQELFPGAQDVEAPSVSVVVAAPKSSTLAEKPYADAVSGLVRDLEAVDHVPGGLAGPVETSAALREAALRDVDKAEAQAREAGRPFDRAEAVAAADQQLDPALPLSKDGRVGTIEFAFDLADPADVTAELQEQVTGAMQTARDAGLTVEASGSGMETMESGGASAEVIGLGIALIILALTFGSLVSAGMPILTAGLGVGLGIAGITALTAFIEVPDSTTILASMLGLAVGIDYALFILARYRSELELADTGEEAMGIAVGTAGSAVVFAGLTVIIALAALSVVGIPFLTAMGLGAAATVSIAVLIALTLIPAVGGMLGSKMFAARFRRYVPRREPSGQIVNHGVRWARIVAKAPYAWAMVVVVGLGAVALPAMDIHLGMPGDSTAPKDTSARQASDLVTGSFGPGKLSPLVVVVDGRDIAPREQQAAYHEITDWAAGLDNVAHAVLVGSNENGATIMIQSATGPQDVRSDALLTALRDTSTIEDETGASIGVTGASAVQADISTKLSGAMAPYLGIVIGLAFLLLIVVFRSILVPLTATLGFLLTILATIGATVAIFQKGAFGLFPGQPIVSFLPIFLIGVVFGLAMDYQVFLVTRIREAYVHGADPREAVVDGFRSSARVVTAAALIMTAVFSGFIFMPDPMIKSMGFGLATAVLFDAFVVRMCLIPALMYLMGERAWWLPAWLDRILPRVDIEGEKLQRRLPTTPIDRPSQVDEQDATTSVPS